MEGTMDPVVMRARASKLTLMDVDHNGLEVLAPHECRELLGSATIGRLALSVRALPVVLPVNFALVSDAVLVLTGGGAVFEAACDHAVVAFETDGINAASQTGWSVLVQGEARVLRGPVEIAEARRVGLSSWGNPGAERYVKIGLELMTGRRLGGWTWSEGLPAVHR